MVLRSLIFRAGTPVHVVFSSSIGLSTSVCTSTSRRALIWASFPRPTSRGRRGAQRQAVENARVSQAERGDVGAHQRLKLVGVGG